VVYAVEDEDEGGTGIGEIVGYGMKPGEEVMVKSEPEDELLEVGQREEYKGVLELGPVLAPVVSEFDEELFNVKLDEGAPDRVGRSYLEMDNG
jgi:hypothetical protein